MPRNVRKIQERNPKEEKGIMQEFKNEDQRKPRKQVGAELSQAIS